MIKFDREGILFINFSSVNNVVDPLYYLNAFNFFQLTKFNNSPDIQNKLTFCSKNYMKEKKKNKEENNRLDSSNISFSINCIL